MTDLNRDTAPEAAPQPEADTQKLLQELQRRQIELEIANEKLRDSEVRLTLALEGSQEALWDWNIPTNEGQYSKHWMDILGYSEGELNNEYKEWESRVHPDDLPQVMADLKAHFDGRTDIYVNEHRQRCKDGGWKWLLGRAKIVSRDANGNPLRMIGTLFDITHRKKIEEELRLSEERLALALENSQQGIWDWNIQTNQGQFSKRWKEILGYTNSEISNDFKEWESRVHPDDLPQVKADLDACFKGKTENFETEHRQRSKDGSWKWLYGRARIVSRDAAGNPLRMIGTLFDNTARREAEEALKESEFFFKESQRAAFIGSYKFDLVTDTWESSDVLDQILGIDLNFGRNLQQWLDLMHPDDADMMTRYFLGHVIANRKPFDKEYRIVRPSDGATRWLSGKGQLTFNAEGNPATLIGTIQDITERKESEEQLRASEAKFRLLFENVNANIVFVDTDGIYRMFNEKAARMLGGEPKDFIGKSVHDIFPEEADFYLQRFSEIAREKKAAVFDDRFQQADGVHWFSSNIQPVMDTKGNVTGVQIVSTDITERKRTEEALRISEERWKFALEGAGDCVWEWDARSGQATFSRRWGEMLGYSEADIALTGNDWVSRTHPDDLPGILAHQQDIQDGKITDIKHETRMQCKDGSWKWILSRGRVIHSDAQGKPLRIVGTNSDVSERKLIEEELRKSEERWKFALEGAGDGVWDRNVQSDHFVYSKRWKEMLGFAEDEIGNTYGEWLSRTHPDDLPAILASERAILSGKASNCINELRMQCKDGRWKWILSRGMITSRDADGNPLRIVGTHTDISERKENEAALRESENRFRLMFERTADALLLLDPLTTHFVDCNQATLDMLHCTDKAGILAQSPNQLSPRHQPDGMLSSEKSREMIAVALKNGSHRFEWIHCSRYRSDFPVEVLLTPIMMENRQLIITTWRDITERKQATEKLRLTLLELEEKRREAELLSEAKSRFLNAASHDLRQPLYAVQLFADALQDESLEKQAQDILHNLRVSVRAMSAQLQMLLDVSRLDMGNVKPKRRKYSIESIFHTLETTYAPIAEHAGVLLRNHPIRGYVHTDIVLVTRLIGNLIDNAIKFSPHGTVLVCARRCQQGIRIEVRDNGPGIPVEHQQRIFDEYYQIDNPARNPDAGLGLGLSISKKMANLLEARLSMKTRIGQGTLFSVTLPSERPESTKRKNA